MNIWNKILELSGLDECSSIKDHLCNLKASEILRVGTNTIKGKVENDSKISGRVKTSKKIKGSVK